MRYAIIGAGMSGLAIANILHDAGEELVVFEKDYRVGGMIKCDVVEGSLFHRTGGHVFNTKREDVMDWFWQHFDREKEFTKTQRNSSIVVDGYKQNIPYPIENHIYLLDEPTQRAFIADLLNMAYRKENVSNFEEFLKQRFGSTLYNLYFQPYNKKVWRRDLNEVPLSWLEGKLPMPTIEEMIFNNINHVKERQFVHSSFYYPRLGGSQFLADRLSKGLDIRTGYSIETLNKSKDGKWIIVGEKFDRVVFCGNVKLLPAIASTTCTIEGFTNEIEALESHGTTSVFCRIDNTSYSWMYLPSPTYEAHRIICTGNFSPTNNAPGISTATIEFTDYISKDDILHNLSLMPYHPTYITHNYESYTYPIQKPGTRDMISLLKRNLEANSLYLLGRFAEWEYYNMDVAIGAAIDLYNDKLRTNG